MELMSWFGELALFLSSILLIIAVAQVEISQEVMQFQAVMLQYCNTKGNLVSSLF